jgi:D-lactate dehydrogenase
MRVAVFSTRPYDRQFLTEANASAAHELTFFEARLDAQTTELSKGFDALCAFVNDSLDSQALKQVADGGVRLVALRAAGFNNVDLAAANELGVAIARVPAYSPHAVAEHTLALALTLNRKLHKAYNRVREGNFALDGLLGFDVFGKTVGVIGTGEIGGLVAKQFQGFGCEVLATDPSPSPELQAAGVRYVAADALFAASDIISLHCPLTPATRHLVDSRAIARMKPGVMLINTSRGAVVDTRAVIAGLKRGAIGSLAIDVYEEEADLFFQDRSDEVIDDDVFARLLTFPNVLVTGHQGFFTREALEAIARTTIANLTAFERDGRAVHPVTLRPSG